MKIAYTISGIYNSGGMENILLQKASYLADALGYDVTIITTDQQGKAPFFPISQKVRLIDLGINYNNEREKHTSLIMTQLSYSACKLKHFHALRTLLLREKFDIVISLMDFDFGFLHRIKDGSRKIIEYHFSKYSKILGETNPLKRLLQKARIALWPLTLRKYDRFVVLTNEDCSQWGKLDNISVIPNFISRMPERTSALNKKRAISVGRFDNQKGFDLLVDAWGKVAVKHPDWELEIIGGGDHNHIHQLVETKGLSKHITLSPPAKDITSHYLDSSLYVMSSRYEGLPLVLIEAMAHGLPIVSFACPCGPSDVLKPDFGILVECYDTDKLANAIITWLNDHNQMKAGGQKAAKEAENYAIKPIMSKWDALFKQLTNA